jgi:hypothetical protein
MQQRVHGPGVVGSGIGSYRAKAGAGVGSRHVLGEIVRFLDARRRLHLLPLWAASYFLSRPLHLEANRLRRCRKHQRSPNPSQGGTHGPSYR